MGPVQQKGFREAQARPNTKRHAGRTRRQLGQAKNHCDGGSRSETIHQLHAGIKALPSLSHQSQSAEKARPGKDVYWIEHVVVFRSEEHTSELQSHLNLVCRLLLEKKKKNRIIE